MDKEQEQAAATKLELRLWNVVVGAFLLLGGWWLQNQYDTTLRLTEQLTTFQRFVDDRYVEKEFLREVTANTEKRLERIESKLDKVLASPNFEGAR